jgi:hypothetical protein
MPIVNVETLQGFLAQCNSLKATILQKNWQKEIPNWQLFLDGIETLTSVANVENP